ncbi:MAG TPA: metalloregulator ArsR/SmtB family transcription factor [Ktedonobacterales bacterium]|nr:metalloregulator ArsR/SmtB family transcription factor [Ktedonobacterales bacterium]HEX5571016.1 metalloregulator ArsR/SmtB family transcription factor [Ktedonobacterales bacterium]
MATGSSAAITALHPEAVAAARAVIPPVGVLDLVTQVYSALADPTRIRILYALAAGELCVRDLAVVCGVSESAVSHQMRLLRDRRLVRSRRAGTTIYYALDNHHLPVLFREAEFHADHVRQALADHPYP